MEFTQKIKKNYAWYCNASEVLFIVWSEAYCDWTYEVVREVVASIECHGVNQS